jgi:hypothetical protein
MPVPAPGEVADVTAAAAGAAGKAVTPDILQLYTGLMLL